MNRIFSLILFIVISNKSFASLEGETLICDKDKRGYNFISSDHVKILGINLNELHIFSVNHSYELTENVIFINQTLNEIDKEKTLTLRPIGWIFRRTLDYISLDYVNGDWTRRFLWTCEITSSKQLKIRIKNTLNKLIKASDEKL